MPRIPNLIIIGGSSRNVGKTTLAVKLIEKYAGSVSITGLKVTSIRPGEDSHHGSHSDRDLQNFRITGETSDQSSKDTARMLTAGADRVFYIETPDNQINNAVDMFLATENTGGPIVCESRNLRIAVIPGLFVLLKHYDASQIKPGFDYYEKLADIILTIDPDTRNSGSLADMIIWDGNSWKYSG
ncbi:MAG: hypothetical protein AB9834_11255 [Lentimicrobium sp.]